MGNSRAPLHTHFTQFCWLTLHSFPTKGPEPENVTVGTVNGRTYAFVGLERIGGVMVYAKTAKEAARLTQSMGEGGMQKTYLAVLTGCPEETSGTLEDLLFHDRAKILFKFQLFSWIKIIKK